MATLVLPLPQEEIGQPQAVLSRRPWVVADLTAPAQPFGRRSRGIRFVGHARLCLLHGLALGLFQKVTRFHLDVTA